MNTIGALWMFRKKGGIDNRFGGAVPADGGVNLAPTLRTVALRAADWTGGLAWRDGL